MSTATTMRAEFVPFILELAQRLDTLDYYAVLGVPEAGTNRLDYVRLRQAYQERVEIVHPDRFAVRGAPAEVMQAATVVYKRMGEAITVVGDPLLRPLYDRERRRGILRLDPMQAADVLTAELRQIHHVFARYYTAQAGECLARGDAEEAQRMIGLGLGCQSVPALVRLRQSMQVRNGRGL